MQKIFEQVPGCYFHGLLVQPRGSDHQYYHVFIGANNRYGFAYLINDNTAATALDSLKQFIKDVSKPGMKLTSDGESAFNSELFTNYCSKHNIRVKIIPDKVHSSLGIVERFIRTLRDMNQPANRSQDQQYSKEYIEFTAEKMQILINKYNNAYHNAIKCTPSEMFNEQNFY